MRYEVNTVMLRKGGAGLPKTMKSEGGYDGSVATTPSDHTATLHPQKFIDPQVFGCAAPSNVPGQGNT